MLSLNDPQDNMFIIWLPYFISVNKLQACSYLGQNVHPFVLPFMVAGFTPLSFGFYFEKINTIRKMSHSTRMPVSDIRT